jgi:hypothetical protein
VRRLSGMTGAVSAALIAAALAAGCSSGAPAAGRPTDDRCFAFVLRAIQRHVTVTAAPRACAGLSAGQVDLAVARAIRVAAGPAPKALARRRASQDSAYVARMFRPMRPAQAGPARPATAAAPPSAGLPLGLSALAAWLLTAAAGAKLIAGWRAAGSFRAPRRTGLAPVTALSHFGLAMTGLGVWVAFVITGVPALAWSGVGLIVVIAGLGMGALSASLPEPGRDPVPGRAGRPVTVIAVHGALATTTILLVLLAAIGAG